MSGPISAQEPLYTLGDWDSKAAVRARQDGYRLPDDLERQLSSRNWFPPAFIPYVEHPLVIQAGHSVGQRLAANHLVYFLDYTTMLEHRVVNRSVEALVHGELAVPIPRQMKTAALQLYTDEGYHALFSHEVAEQIASFYGIHDRPPARRIGRLLEVIQRCPLPNRPLGWFLLGFVSETIIARELLTLTRKTLVSTVYRMLRTHLEDEARHSRYFSEVFSYLWPLLDATQRQLAARLLLEIIKLYFEPDMPWLMRSLASVGFDEPASRQILAGIVLSHAHAARVRSGAASTFLAMKRAGFFDDDHNRALFCDAGFIDA
ncbi:diiron oxygenase [Pseudomonas sp. R1-7]|uniref:diiron oxygenase n=1 Tax=Pseudomonas sp. R1-7 TaxID=2817398 RepID=UPI003DA82D5D